MDARLLARRAARAAFPVLFLGIIALIKSLPAGAGEDARPPPSRPAEEPARKVKLLYVDGYPRWEYRYLSRAMVVDESVEVSCLLTSADVGTPQQGDPPDPKSDFPGPITRFPETMEELLKYDVMLFGDVDSRQFTDRQLALVADFVTKHGRGFGMVAGPRYAPAGYRASPLAAVMPVNIDRVRTDDGLKKPEPLTEGFRPVLTEAGALWPAFRHLREPDGRAFKEQMQPFYWHCLGVMALDGATVLATHPTDKGPDDRPAPLLVIGRSGAGRTLFSAIDDTWRWRYATGDEVFSSYWREQVRYLAGERGGDTGQGAAATRPASQPAAGNGPGNPPARIDDSPTGFP